MTQVFKGTTLARSYEKGIGITVNKTFLVDMDKIFIEPGFNVRELDQEHIESLHQAFLDGQPIPAIVGKTTPQGFKVIDGHHRYEAAKLAGVTRLECKDFLGTDADIVALMITSSQSKNLTAVDRARAYLRLKGFGLTTAQIADKVKRSRADVDSHLLLMTASSKVIESVQSGQIGFSVVVNELRKNNGEAVDKAVSTTQAAGGTKTRAADINPFTKADHVRVMEILSGMRLDPLPAELGGLIKKYRGEV